MRDRVKFTGKGRDGKIRNPLRSYVCEYVALYKIRSLIQSPIICPNQKCVNSEVQNTIDCVFTCTPPCRQKLLRTSQKK